MNPVLFDFGFIRIYWYSVLIFIAILVGGYLALREAKKWNIPENFMLNLFFYLIPIALIGARLYFVVFNWSDYVSDPISIFKVWEGGLAIHGAILAGLAWVIIYTKKYKVNTWRVLDSLVVGLLIGQAIGRWGNFFNGEAHGPATTESFLKGLFLPNFIIEGMNIGGTYYHPTFLYESLWCVVGFVFLLVMRRRKYIKIGQVTGMYLMWYSVGRFFIEGMRTDSLMFLGLKQAQIISIVLFIAGLVVLFLKGRGSKLDNQYNDKENIDEVLF